MSVLRSNRNISEFEYEHTMSTLYALTERNLMKVAGRRKKWLCDSISNIMNSVMIQAMDVTDTYFASKEEKKKFKEASVLSMIENLNRLDKPLIVLWNVERYEMKKMSIWVNQIQKEVCLLNDMHSGEDIPCRVFALDNKAISSAKFLLTMSNLHRYTHGKVVGALKAVSGTTGALLISLVDDALYHVFLANRHIPTSKIEYEERRRHISAAIKRLNQMNRPMISFFNLMNYSENVLQEWSGMLYEELKLLQGLQKSDRQRFSKLP